MGSAGLEERSTMSELSTARLDVESDSLRNTSLEV